MRITQESDYALRIVTALALADSTVDAGTLSEETSVTPRFTLKILHKLVHSGIVSSSKGANGGYRLSRPAEDLTMKDVIEAIEGPIIIARCLHSDENCSQNGLVKSDCRYHHIFREVSSQVADTFSGIRIADVISSTQKERKEAKSSEL